MCMVSAVLDYGRERIWPDIVPVGPSLPTTIPNWPNPVSPSVIPNVVPDWSQVTEQLKKYSDALQAAKEVDKVTKQPDCEDPKKVEWATNLCNRLIEIGTELIKDTEKSSLGVELIQIAKDIKDTLDS